MRMLCILLPNFPFRCEAERCPDLVWRPAAVTYTAGNEKLVLDYSPELNGLWRDMPVQQALASYYQLDLVHADVNYYWRIFGEMLDALELKSPLVEGANLGEIYIGLLGLDSLYLNDDATVAAMKEALPENFEIQLGIAGGKFPSYLAATQSKYGAYNTYTGDIASQIKDLSCDLLSVSSKSKEKLHEFGLHTLGSIASLPQSCLEAQFGPEGGFIWQLANGQDDTPLYPRLSEEKIEESTTLPSPAVSLDVLFMAMESMISRIFKRLKNRGIGIRRITIWTRTWLSEYWEKCVNFKNPATNIKSILSRIRQVMESSTQPGPVEHLGIKVTGLGYQIGRQGSILKEIRSQDHLLDDIQQLEFRLGGPQLFKVKEIEPWSRIPERRYVLRPLDR